MADIDIPRDISSQTQFTHKVKMDKLILLMAESKRIKNDRELDQALKDTFPASDAIAKYL